MNRNLSSLCSEGEFNFETMEGNYRWVGAYMFYEGSEEWNYLIN